MGCIDGLVAAFEQFILEEGFEDAADDGPFGEPEDEAAADEGRDGEEAEFLADAAMVAFLGFLDLVEVGVEVFFIEEGGAVDALEDGAVGAAFPVSAGDGEEFERADFSGVGDVWAAAEVDELALAVEAEDSEFVQFFVDVFDFEVLSDAGAEFAGIWGGEGESFEGFCGGDDFGHFGFDGGKIFFRDRTIGEGDVVVEAGAGGWTEGEARAWVESHEGARHDVGGGVS